MELHTVQSPSPSFSVFSANYAKLDGFAPIAPLGIGVGISAQFAQLKRGDTVLDLGCGAGNDSFVAAKLVGDEGHVIGLDNNPLLLKKAIANKEEQGLSQVEFRLGDIIRMPIKGKKVQVVIGQGVMHLVTDKYGVYKEIYRVLKPGGYFNVSDIVVDGILPKGLIKAAEHYLGSVQGSLSRADYISTIEQCGFEKIQIKKNKLLNLPAEIVSKYITDSELQAYKDSGVGIHQITIMAIKPEHDGGCGDACTCGKSKKN